MGLSLIYGSVATLEDMYIFAGLGIEFVIEDGKITITGVITGGGHEV